METIRQIIIEINGDEITVVKGDFDVETEFLKVAIALTKYRNEKMRQNLPE